MTFLVSCLAIALLAGTFNEKKSELLIEKKL